MLSGCVIVRDEAGLLAGCLESLRPHVDELIVVDNGSADDSAAVARRFGAAVIPLPGVNHEHGRNAYLEAATRPWVLVLDADERLTPDAGGVIRRAVADARADTFGFGLPRFDYVGGGRWSTTRLVRLFRR